MDELLPDTTLTGAQTLIDDSGYEIISETGSYTPDEPIDVTGAITEIPNSSFITFLGDGGYMVYFVVTFVLVGMLYFIFRYIRSSKR